MTCQVGMYQRPATCLILFALFASSDLDETKADESAMLVDPEARLGQDGVYARAGR